MNTPSQLTVYDLERQNKLKIFEDSLGKDKYENPESKNYVKHGRGKLKVYGDIAIDERCYESMPCQHFVAQIKGNIPQNRVLKSENILSESLWSIVNINSYLRSKGLGCFEH